MNSKIWRFSSIHVCFCNRCCHLGSQGAGVCPQGTEVHPVQVAGLARRLHRGTAVCTHIHTGPTVRLYDELNHSSFYSTGTAHVLLLHAGRVRGV